MNKKILILLALVFSTLSIMIIAVWGTLPENTNRIPIETITIDDYDGFNEDGDKLKDVTGLVTETNNIYLIEYSIQPGIAFASQVTVTTASNAARVQIDPFSHQVSVYYDLTKISQKPTVTIRIIDQSTQKFDEITLLFKNPGTIIVPDIE